MSALSRGESLIASLGLGGTLLMLGAVALSGFWTLRSVRETRLEARSEQTRAIANLLAHASAPLIEEGRLSELQTLVAGVGAKHGYGRVWIALADARQAVIADTTPGSKPSVAALPERWNALADTPAELVASTSPDGASNIQVPIVIPNRGTLTLSINDHPTLPLSASWEVHFGIGAIAAFGLGGVLVAYRIARRRLRALGAIRESLVAVKNGETDLGALGIAADFGQEAQAWNQMLGETQRLRRELVDRASGETMTTERRSENSPLASLCDAMWQGLVLVDDQLRVRYANGAGANFLRAKRDSIEGSSLTSMIKDPAIVDAVRSVATGKVRTRTTVETELAPSEPEPNEPTVERPGEAPRSRTILRFSVRPVRKDDSATALVIIEDVTQLRVADESRHAFVASATHELRTPLTNVRLYVDSLLEDPAQDPRKRSEAMNVISSEVKRLERMIGDMLSVSQIEAGSLKLSRGDVRLEPIFDELRADFAQQAKEKEITLRFDLPPKWPQLEGDRDKIVMALHNLIGNAIKYTPVGGVVSVRVQESTNGGGPTLSVDVIDNGIGIKPEEQALVFERFYRAKDRRLSGITGTGLGLSIAREVVRLHGGDIAVQSEIDKGSTFTMTLPAKAA